MEFGLVHHHLFNFNTIFGTGEPPDKKVIDVALPRSV
jgi:hypothetical protein